MNRGEDGGDGVDRRPLGLNDVQAQRAVLVNIWMKHAGNKLNSRWRLRVILGELKPQLEHTSLPGCVRRTKDASFPCELNQQKRGR